MPGCIGGDMGHKKKKPLTKAKKESSSRTTSTIAGPHTAKPWDSIEARLKGPVPYRYWIEALALLVIIGIGFLVRIEDIRDWEAHPEYALYKGEPLLTTFDGYYYLTQAKDLIDGTYTPIDNNRNVPEGMHRRAMPPLISIVAAVLAKITPFSLNWIGAMLPAFLGVLLAIPLYALGRFYGGPSMGLSGALMGLVSFYYVYRSSLGWFDTDCMNVTWATGATYCFLRFGVETGKRRYLYFLCGMLIYLFFLWWWDSTPQVVTVISMLPLAVALLFFYRPPRKEGSIFLAILGLGIGLVLWMRPDLPIEIFKSVVGTYHYISTKKVVGIWPPIGATISEEAIPSFSEIVAKTTDSLPAFILAVAGLGWLFWDRPREGLFLSVPMILAALSFFFAKRFLIFFAPVTALGIGYLISRVWYWRRRFALFAIVAPISVVLLAWPEISKGMAKNFWPKEPPYLIAGMDLASRKTPRDAVIWAWWDHGYPLNYWAGRGTIGDGALHGGHRSFYNGLPLATHSERLAANFMRFYVSCGMTGIEKVYKAVGDDPARGVDLIKKVLSVGPEAARTLLAVARLRPVGNLQNVDQWLKFFYPEKTRPVYLFLDWRLTITDYWWFWLGTWDIKKRDGIHPTYKAFYDLYERDNHIKGRGGLDIDLETGILHIGNRMTTGLRRIVETTRHGLETKNYPGDSRLVFDMFSPARFGALMDRHISESVFNKLYLLHVYNPKYFRPVGMNAPAYQLWEVIGDKLEKSKGKD